VFEIGVSRQELRGVQFSKAAAASFFILSPQDFISPVNKSTTMKYGIGHK